MRNSLLLLSLLLGIVMGSQYNPIPKHKIGLFVGDKNNARLEIELIYDPACGDTYNFDHKFRAIWANFSADTQSKILLRYVPYSMPHHITAQKINQGMVYGLKQTNDSQALKYFTEILDNKQDWTEPKTKSETIGAFLNRLADKVASVFGVNRSEAYKNLLHGSDSDREVRVWSKYVMGELRTPGAPYVRFNGVQVDGVADMTSQQISEMIENLLK